MIRIRIDGQIFRAICPIVKRLFGDHNLFVHSGKVTAQKKSSSFSGNEKNMPGKKKQKTSSCVFLHGQITTAAGLFFQLGVN